MGPVRELRRTRSLPALILPGGSEELQLASYLGEGEAEERAAGWGSAVTQPPGQAARSGFPSAFPLLAPPRPPPRSDSAGPARCVSLRALCLPLTGRLCSAVCLTRSAVCGSRCVCLRVHLPICSSCRLQCLCLTRSVIMSVYMTLRGCLCLCVCLAPV